VPPPGYGGIEAVVALTKRLVRVRSQNPIDREADCARELGTYLANEGWITNFIEVEPGRPNVVARIRGGDGPPLVVLGHLDTVPVADGWRHDPFAAEEHDGRIYGLGAVDMKGGAAAAAVAAGTLLRSGRPLRGDVVFCGTCDEEGAMVGVRALVQAGIVTRDAFILAPEPTECDIVIAHKGAFQYELSFAGRAAHASAPEEGTDAALGLMLALVELDRLVTERHETSPILGRSTLVASRLEAGRKTNVVADAARAEIDARTLPTLPRSELEQLLDAALAVGERATGARPTRRLISPDRPPTEADPASALVEALLGAFPAAAGRDGRTAGYPAYTDVAMAAAVTGARHWAVFGPGSLAQAHGPDEFVTIEQLALCANVLAQAFQALMLDEAHHDKPRERGRYD